MVEAATRSDARASLALFVLFLVAVVNVMDRYVLIALIEPIKQDLDLSDAQLGALTGLSFALIYTLAAFPFAALSDRWFRTRLLSFAVVLWSLLTGLSGLAANFWQLVACRMGVAAGEAGCVPNSHSLLMDYFPPAKRPLAFALWGQSQPIGVMLGFLVGGWLAATYGWRTTFIIFGLGSMLLVPAILLLREPVRGQFDDAPVIAPPPLRKAPLLLWRNRPARYFLIAASVHCIMQFTVQSWSASLYSRSFGMPVDDVALYLTFVIGAAGCVGVLLGGVVVRRLGTRDTRWYVWLPACADLLLVPAIMLQFLSNDLTTSLIFGFLATILLNMLVPCLPVTLQTSVHPSMRAVSTAIAMASMNIVGVGLGPLGVGVASDLLNAAGHGTDSLRYAVVGSMIFAPVAAFFFYRSGQAFGEVPQLKELSRG